MQGYFGQVSGEIDGHKVQVTLIARRMHRKWGSQKINRGIDDQGYVANQVEKEQILVVDDRQMASHVQLSGSVPVFWEQKGLKEGITITRSPALTKPAFRKHVADVFETYSSLTVINLLRYLKKSKEMTITSEYVRQYSESEFREKINFVNFDFHGYCGNERYHNMKAMIHRTKDCIAADGWLVENLGSKLVESH